MAPTVAVRVLASGADTGTASGGAATAIDRTGARGRALARATSLEPSSALLLAGTGAGAAKGRVAAGSLSGALAAGLDAGGGAGSFGGVCDAASFCADAGMTGSGVDAGVTGSAVGAGVTGSGAIAS